MNLRWVMPHAFTKCHRNWLSSLCVILQTKIQTQKRKHKQKQKQNLFVEVNKELICCISFTILQLKQVQPLLTLFHICVVEALQIKNKWTCDTGGLSRASEHGRPLPTCPDSQAVSSPDLRSAQGAHPAQQILQSSKLSNKCTCQSKINCRCKVKLQTGSDFTLDHCLSWHDDTGSNIHHQIKPERRFRQNCKYQIQISFHTK